MRDIEIVLRDILIEGLLEELGDEKDLKDAYEALWQEELTSHEATLEMFNDNLGTFSRTLGERDEARGIAATLYLVLGAALKAFNAEPYGEEIYQKNARRELWDILETTPEWVQRMDGAL